MDGEAADISAETTAAMRYKEIIGLANKAAADLRTWELARADELEAKIAEGVAEVEAAGEREERVTQDAHRWWRMAEDNVRRLPWLELADPPEAAPNARGDRLDRHLDDVRSIYNDLVQAVLRLGWRSRG